MMRVRVGNRGEQANSVKNAHLAKAVVVAAAAMIEMTATMLAQKATPKHAKKPRPIPTLQTKANRSRTRAAKRTRQKKTNPSASALVADVVVPVKAHAASEASVQNAAHQSEHQRMTTRPLQIKAVRILILR